MKGGAYDLAAINGVPHNDNGDYRVPLSTIFTDLSPFGATFLAFVGFIAWIIAYYRETNRRRLETFLSMRKEFRDSNGFGRVFMALEHDIEKTSVNDLTDDECAAFASFLEEVAVMMQSRVIPRPLASYFFGYYAIVAANNKDFMRKIEGDSIYWALLRQFVTDMESEQIYLSKATANTVKKLKIGWL